MTDIIDKQELLEELDGDREFLEESVELLDSDAPPLLEQIRDALQRGDSTAISSSAHTLKSMVGNFCAQPAFDAALKVETIGRSGDLEQCSEPVESLQTEVGRLQKALRELLDESETW
jgi:HPt (histidine-containing phosphotransfer) domain-containing protein